AGTWITGCEDTMLSDTGATARRPAAARRTHENERRPTLERYAAHEREAACAIAGKRSAGLCRERAREQDPPVGRNGPRHRGGERFERIEQDIGEDQSVGGTSAERCGKDTGGMDDRHNGTDPVDARVVARDSDGAGIDIAGDYGSTQGRGRGDGKHA